MDEAKIGVSNMQFMLNSIKILLECGEAEHAIQLIDAFLEEITSNTEKLS